MTEDDSLYNIKHDSQGRGLAIEKRFNVRFKSNEIRNWENVNEMIESILAK